MRLYVVFAILCGACVLAGCHTHQPIDNFGKCQECQFCTRPAATENWKLTIESKPASGERSVIDTELMEKTDQIFQWVEIYKNLQSLQNAYIARLQDSKRWYTAYSKCDATNQSWEQYWQTMNEVAIQFLKIKEVIVKRIGYLLSREGIASAETDATLAMLRHLRMEMNIYGEDLIKIMNALDNRKVLPKVAQREMLPQAIKNFNEAAVSAERDRTGGIEMGSDAILEQLKNCLQNIEKVPLKK